MRTSYCPTTVRYILCVFPHYMPSFGTFHHAYALPGGIHAFMPPQGLLPSAAYLPTSWRVRFVDEDAQTATPKDFSWADAVLVSGMHVRRPHIWGLGVRGDDRRAFWAMAARMLGTGRFEQFIDSVIVSHHLIEFARQCLAGMPEPSFYTAARSLPSVLHADP